MLSLHLPYPNLSWWLKRPVIPSFVVSRRYKPCKVFLFLETLTPVPLHNLHNKLKAVVTYGCFSEYFQVSLEDMTCSPRKPHYVSKKPFHTVLVYLYVCEREREREREPVLTSKLNISWMWSPSSFFWIAKMNANAMVFLWVTF